MTGHEKSCFKASCLATAPPALFVTDFFFFLLTEPFSFKLPLVSPSQEADMTGRFSLKILWISIRPDPLISFLNGLVSQI